MSRKPFARLPYGELSELPTRPHPYFATVAREVTVKSAHFGPLKIHYREYGSGPPLLLVHGLMTSSYSWRYVLEGLGAHFRLIIPDLPGAGASDKPAKLHAASVAAFIGELQTALGLRGCAAIGNSLGGYLCMLHALDDPGAFSRLVNIHSPAFPLARLHALHAVLSLPGTQAALAWWVRRDTNKWIYKNVHYYDESLKSVEELRQYGEPLATPKGVRSFISYLAEIMAPSGFADFIARLERRRAAGEPFVVPLALIYARQDPLVPPVIGEWLSALIPDARLMWLDRSSHFTHVDSPERVLPLLLDFLAPELEAYKSAAE
jgi:pimeloyl-ACP methyl ester carboxylesterase